MGEDTIDYSHSSNTTATTTGAATNRPYPNSFPVEREEQTTGTGPEMVPYAMHPNETYCMDDKMVENKMFQEDVPTYHTERPQLHHMPSISTTCTSDSFHSSMTSADSGELSAYDLNTSDSQEYDWSISQTSHFQWPPNRNSRIIRNKG